MSWQPAIDPKPGETFACDAIDMVIVPRVRDLGGFSVRRALPSTQRQMVGPFIFFDQMDLPNFCWAPAWMSGRIPISAYQLLRTFLTGRSFTGIP